MNYQVFVGNVVRDPELRATKSGLSKTTLSVAINEGDREKGTEKAHFIRVNVLGRTAENTVKSIGKGDRVVVVARIDTYAKEVEVNGEDRNITITEFTATAIGPELHYASADVARNPKNSDDDDRDPGEQPETAKRGKAAADDPDTNDTNRSEDGDADPEPPARSGSGKPTARSRAKAPVDDDEF
ncbi:single-stranded DNA-binding protein [Nakamurella multipartita]|uniref:Single-stranded DNA-binding protein n=1 Tax=Nakamurella multipartita (strain ATCC 700099 / DSM 44233 / CIP 104796 / JCM 9543 / NBRC 105858 / Y-104) TaxID=479431 RepID=C8X8N7_NAKMY|nr:single-stranded DNA-binding protein [Nakamurella multipartita]ACV79092.1 single-strand binding protein [Nakamurella multipartita DSM 44233]